MRKNRLLIIAIIIGFCNIVTNSFAVYAIPAVNLAHANKLESIGRYAQAAQERELAVKFYQYFSIPQFEDDMQFFRSLGDSTKVKFCESTIAGFKKSMKLCQKKFEENLEKAQLTKEQIYKYRERNRIRLLASAKLYPVMHNQQMGIDLGKIEKNAKFSEDFEKAAQGRERTARLYEKLTVNYLVKEAEALEKEGNADMAEDYRKLAKEYIQKAKEDYEIAEKYRNKAEELKKFDNIEFLMSSFNDTNPEVRELTIEKFARTLNYIGLLMASQSQNEAVSKKAKDMLQENKMLFNSISPIALFEALSSDNLSVREIAITELRKHTNIEFGYDPEADEHARKIAIASWQGWFTAKLQQGLVGIYYREKDFKDEVLSRIDKKIDFKWEDSPANEIPIDGFSVRWFGKINIPQDDKYTLSFKNYDKIKVWLGKTLNTMKIIATDWSEYDYGGYETELELKKGFYNIRIDFSDYKNVAHIKFSWDSEHVTKGVVPAENLFHIEF